MSRWSASIEREYETLREGVGQFPRAVVHLHLPLFRTSNRKRCSEYSHDQMREFESGDQVKGIEQRIPEVQEENQGHLRMLRQWVVEQDVQEMHHLEEAELGGVKNEEE